MCPRPEEASPPHPTPPPTACRRSFLPPPAGDLSGTRADCQVHPRPEQGRCGHLPRDERRIVPPRGPWQTRTPLLYTLYFRDPHAACRFRNTGPALPLIPSRQHSTVSASDAGRRRRHVLLASWLLECLLASKAERLAPALGVWCSALGSLPLVPSAGGLLPVGATLSERLAQEIFNDGEASSGEGHRPPSPP